MGLWEQLPYINFHGVNLKWILDRMVEFETRLTTAEDDIDALEGRMDTAEDDIDALEGRMDTAEDDIDALEGRMDTAEGNIQDNADDILGLQTQMPSSIAADAGRVLTATGAGAAEWQDPRYPFYLDLDADDPTTPLDPRPARDAFRAGRSVYLRRVHTNGYNVAYLYHQYGTADGDVCRLYFFDPRGEIAHIIDSDWTEGEAAIIALLRNSGGSLSWLISNFIVPATP